VFAELKRDEFEAVRGILGEVTQTLLVRTVYEGTSPGTIWVDDVANPRTALVRTPEGHELAGSAPEGDAAAGLRALVLEQMIPEGRERGWAFFGLGYPGESWRAFLSELFEGQDPVWDFSHYLKFRKQRVDWRNRLPEGFEVRRVDAALLGQDELGNILEVRGWAEGNFGTREAFLERGFGFCVVEGETIASWCLSDCVSGHRCEIGIHTDERYRRRGLATCAVAATVEHCLGSGLTEIGWHCGSANTPSLAVAQAIGFEKVAESHYVLVALHRADGMFVHGNQCLLRGQYAEAAGWFERGFAELATRGSGEPTSRVVPDRAARRRYHYKAACAWALAGDDAAAQGNLEKALDYGTERWMLL
jgi:GNAT superfamily N-acetyltransferase